MSGWMPGFGWLDPVTVPMPTHDEPVAANLGLDGGGLPRIVVSRYVTTEAFHGSGHHYAGKPLRGRLVVAEGTEAPLPGGGTNG